jgi:hypothetical protein
MVFYVTWYVRYDENTSNDTSAQHFRTKHSFLIFYVQETLYYLNVASKNRMPHFRRPGLSVVLGWVGFNSRFAKLKNHISVNDRGFEEGK